MRELDYEDAVELDAIMEDAKLVRQLKEEIRGLKTQIAISGATKCGNARVLAVARVWRRIVLEANQGV